MLQVLYLNVLKIDQECCTWNTRRKWEGVQAVPTRGLMARARCWTLARKSDAAGRSLAARAESDASVSLNAGQSTFILLALQA